MLKCKLDNPYTSNWHHQGDYSARGYLFFNNRLYEGADLLDLMKEWSSQSDFVAAVRQANGSFALVKHTADSVWAAVDRLRTIPLFYSHDGDDFFLSDDARWLQEQVNATSWDAAAANEFLFTGYVTGPDTLYPGIKQLQAGEALFAQNASAGVQVRTERYYRYLHHDYFVEPRAELTERMDAMLLAVARRLVRSVAGRPLLVPLSGGYDSRLLVLLLKRLGYDNVICFSYGKPGNRESLISEQVASLLGYRWEFVPYSNDQWYQWYRSPQARQYIRYAENAVSVAHIQDWPAVWVLKQEGRVPADSVFVPGHSADFLAGSHIPPSFNTSASVGTRKLIDAILDRHYSLQVWSRKHAGMRRQFARRILRLVADIPHHTAAEAANAFESWDWQERQAKFICNSVRVYEFWGYDWRLPFWDAEMMEFWERVPLEHRIAKAYFYDAYVDRLLCEVGGHCAGLPAGDYPGRATTRLAANARKALSRTPLYHAARSINWLFRRALWRRQYESHPLCFYGVMSACQFKKLYRGKNNINAFLAWDRVAGVLGLCGQQIDHG